jgi:acyl-CoA thioester hydrolase
MSEGGERVGRTGIRVRYDECDPMGVAHHTAYPGWFEIGRTELLREAGMRYRDLERRGVLIAVASLSVRYRSPARYDDVLELHTRVTAFGRATIDHAYELYRDGALLATGQTRVVCLDSAGRPRPLPDDVADLLS